MQPEPLYDGHGWKLVLETAPLPDGRTKTNAFSLGGTATGECCYT